MSGKIMGLVWDRSLPTTQRSVLLALADRAAHDGTSVYPSVALVAWMTDLSERSVQRAMRWLENSGALVLVREATRHRPREYRIKLDALPKKGPMPARSGATD